MPIPKNKNLRLELLCDFLELLLFLHNLLVILGHLKKKKIRQFGKTRFQEMLETMECFFQSHVNEENEILIINLCQW